MTTPQMDAVGEPLFSFEHEGETYSFERPFSVVRAPGWLRANRRRDELDLAFTILEAIAGEDTLAVIDGMDEAAFYALSQRVNKELNASFL